MSNGPSQHDEKRTRWNSTIRVTPSKSRARSSSPKRGGKPKARNTKRQASEFKRCYGSQARKKFVGSLPCANCGWEPTADQRCDNAHVTGEDAGAGRKGSYRGIAPLCPPHGWLNGWLMGCHRLSHRDGWSALFNMYSPEKREAAAAATEAAWLAQQERSE